MVLVSGNNMNILIQANIVVGYIDCTKLRTIMGFCRVDAQCNRTKRFISSEYKINMRQENILIEKLDYTQLRTIMRF